jgi:SsrA-binding protein
MEILNRKASHDYFIKDTYEAGIELKGTEIKSIRKGNANINDSYARVRNNEIFVTNMYIAKYEEGNIFNHDERRERKLLLHKNEILKISHNIETNRYTLIPLKLYFKKNKIKVELGICQGKKLYDKRESIKERDLKRRIE